MTTSATFPLIPYEAPEQAFEAPVDRMLTDLQLIDPNTWDLAIVAGKIPLVHGPYARAQRLAIALKHVRGEWYLDQNAGTDWFGKVLGKSSDLSRRAEIRRRVLGVPGVRQVASIQFHVDPATRRLSGNVVAVDVNGQTLAIPLEEVV